MLAATGRQPEPAVKGDDERRGFDEFLAVSPGEPAVEQADVSAATASTAITWSRSSAGPT
jgi:hypothetical protein